MALLYVYSLAFLPESDRMLILFAHSNKCSILRNYSQTNILYIIIHVYMYACMHVYNSSRGSQVEPGINRKPSYCSWTEIVRSNSILLTPS